MLSADFLNSNVGMAVFVIGSAMFSSISFVLLKWLMNSGIHALTSYLLLQGAFTVGSILTALLVFCLWRGSVSVVSSDMSKVTPQKWLYLLVFGFCTVLFVLGLVLVLEKTKVSVLGPINSALGIIFVVLIGMYFLKETLTWTESVGIGTLLLGLSILTYALYTKK